MTDQAQPLSDKRTDRQSNIELLRIVAMVMIIGCHFAEHGGFDFGTQLRPVLPKIWWFILYMGGKLGVDLFVFITGFFLIENTDLCIKPKKVLKLWGQIVFYSVVLFFVGCFIGKETFSGKSLIETLLPISFEKWWFASTYFVLYLLHPYLNRLLHSLSKKEYQGLVLFLLVIWSILPALTETQFQSNTLLKFVVYYAIAGYIKLHGFNHPYSGKKWFALWFGFSALSLLLCGISLVGKKFGLFSIPTDHFFRQNSILTICRAVCFFMAFLNLDIKTNRFINTVSSAAFGVYLLHDSTLLRPVLWQEIFKNAQYRDSLFLIPYSIIVILIVYIGCTAIDLLRQRFIERPYMLLVNRYTDAIIRPFSKAFEFFRTKICQSGEERLTK